MEPNLSAREADLMDQLHENVQCVLVKKDGLWTTMIGGSNRDVFTHEEWWKMVEELKGKL